MATTLRYVIDADANPAVRQMRQLQERAAVLDKQLTEAKRLQVDDKLARAKIIQTGIAADRLREKLSMDLTVRGTAAAEARLLVLEHSADRLHDKLSAGRGGIRAGVNGLVSLLETVGSTGTAAINPITIALGGLAAIMSGPLIAAMLPITAGFAGLAAVAVPEMTKVAKAVEKGGKALKALSPAERQLVNPMKDLHDQWHRLTVAVQPAIVRLFGSALRVIKDLLPVLRPLIIATARALRGFFNHIDAWLHSASGKKFLHWLKTEGPQDIAKFGRFLWTMAQVAGRVFSFLRNAGNHWWRNFHAMLGSFHAAWSNTVSFFATLGRRLARFFTKTIPTAFDLFVNFAKLTWLRVERSVLRFVYRVTGIMGRLPGPLGAPFRAAHKSIGGQLAAINRDVAKTADRINRDWDKLHGKTITVGFQINTLATSRRGRKPTIGAFAAGTGGAAPGWAWVGERGPELVRFRGGETVLPHEVSRRAAGDPPGYAGGAGWHIRDVFRPPVGVAIKRFNAQFQRAENTVAAALRTALSSSFGDSGVRSASAAAAQRFARSRLGAFGWGASQWAPLLYLWNRESGWSPYAVNRSSGAYGIPQSLGHGHPYSLGDYPAQVMWGLRYIAGRYGSPAAAWGHENRFGWYGKGTGGAAPGWAWVGERGRELVHFTGGETVVPHAAAMQAAGAGMPGYAQGTRHHLTAKQKTHRLIEAGMRLAGSLKPGDRFSWLQAAIATLHRDRLLSHARGLPRRSRRHYAALAASAGHRVHGLGHELAALRAYRGHLESLDATDSATMRAAKHQHLAREAARLGKLIAARKKRIERVNLRTVGHRHLAHKGGGGGTKPLKPITVKDVTSAFARYFPAATYGFAGGGQISEPIAGLGLRTGARYSFGEHGSEYVASNADMKAVTALLGRISAQLDALHRTTAAGPARTGQAMGNALNSTTRRVALGR